MLRKKITKVNEILFVYIRANFKYKCPFYLYVESPKLSISCFIVHIPMYFVLMKQWKCCTKLTQLFLFFDVQHLPPLYLLLTDE